MLSILVEDLDGDVMGVRVSGTLTLQDYERLAPWAEAEAARPGKRRVLVDMRGFMGWDDLEEATAHLRLGTAVARELDAVAIVGDQRWHGLMIGLSAPFTPVLSRYFEPERYDEALRWICA